MNSASAEHIEQLQRLVDVSHCSNFTVLGSIKNDVACEQHLIFVFFLGFS